MSDMQRVRFLTYAPIGNRLARYDQRAKFVAFILCTVSVFNVVPPIHLVYPFGIFIIYWWAGVPLLRSLWSIRMIILFALLVILSHMATPLLLSNEGVLVSHPQSLVVAAAYPVRLVSVALLAHLFISSISRTELIELILWLAYPLRRIRGALALLTMLTLTFAELAFRQHMYIRRAIRARLGARRRHYTPRILLHHCRQLVIRLASHTHVITYALEARQYSAYRRHTPKRLSRSDWMLLFIAGSIFGTILMMRLHYLLI